MRATGSTDTAPPTRRDALRLLGAAMLPVMLGGGRAGAETPAQDVPRRGGRIRVAGYSGSSADTLDPARQSLSTDYVRGGMFYDGLTELDEALTAQPCLAMSVESDDLLRWTVRLRPSVRFHDGSKLTAADVAYSLNRHRDPAVGSQQKVLAEQMQSVRALGPLLLEIQLVLPNIDLPIMLALPHFRIIRDGTRDFRTANGTGPFRCREFRPGIGSISVRNPDYWRDGRPYLDEIEFFAISDDMARHDALMSGDVELISGVNPLLATLLQKRGLTVMESVGGNYTDLVMRLDRSPGRDPDFVLGMKHLFDREQMKSAIFRDYARVGNDQPVAPGHPFFDATLAQRTHDPDRARFHLKRSGMLGQPVPIVCSPAATGSVEMAILLQESGRRVGLDLRLQRRPADGYWSNSWMKDPLSFGNINPRPTADMAFSLSFASGAPWNESRWRDPQFDRLLLAARGERDPARRASMYADMQRLVHDESGIGIPVFISDLDAFSPRVCGMRPRRTGGLMGYDFARYIWLAA